MKWGGVLGGVKGIGNWGGIYWYEVRMDMWYLEKKENLSELVKQAFSKGCCVSVNRGAVV